MNIAKIYHEPALITANYHELAQGMENFRPRGESFQNITQSYPPPGIEGANVITIAAHGYPLFFAAEGAHQVDGFDICEQSIVWNRFLRGIARVLDFDEAQAVLKRSTSDINPAAHHDFFTEASESEGFSANETQSLVAMYANFCRLSRPDKQIKHSEPNIDSDEINKQSFISSP